MRDRSRMSPEKSLFPRDDRTLEQRYEDVRAERDDLELRLRDLTEILIDVVQRTMSVDELAAEMRKRADSAAPMPAPVRRRPHDDRPVASCVYYVEMSGRVKIGFTTSFTQRMQTMHVLPRQLLAIEPGGRVEEHARHLQFAEERIPGTELFNRSDRLDEHIKTLREKRPSAWYIAAKTCV